MNINIEDLSIEELQKMQQEIKERKEALRNLPKSYVRTMFNSEDKDEVYAVIGKLIDHVNGNKKLTITFDVNDANIIEWDNPRVTVTSFEKAEEAKRKFHPETNAGVI